MKIMKKNIEPNKVITTFFFLESFELRRSKNDKNYLILNLRDKTGKLKGFIWNDPIIALATLRENSFVKIYGTTRIFNDLLVIDIEKIRIAEEQEIDIRDYFEIVPGGIDLWKSRLIDLIYLIRDVNCRKLLDAFLEDEHFLEDFTTCPGGISIHHNYIGGLLEHTVNTMINASTAAGNNPRLLDKDLMLTGAFLHDIGKIKELSWKINTDYTTEGKLLGHICLGLLLLENRLLNLKNFPCELALQLRHIIISHHGKLEYGSPVIPATPEAIVINLIEGMDSKINRLNNHIWNYNADIYWTQFDKILNTQIYLKKVTKQIDVPDKNFNES